MSEPQGSLSRTPLYALHQELGARLVPFAGYEMPVQYPAGIVKEHQHTRSAAGLFDVSHMGQIRLVGSGAAAALERLVSADIVGLTPGRQRYALFTSETGGILDDLMVTNRGEDLLLVVNAACTAADIEHLRNGLPKSITVEPLPQRGLIALQGPAARAVLSRLAPHAPALRFMEATALDVAGIACWVSCSGYTGEDGFEISMAARDAEALTRRLLAEPEVAPVGLGARDSLRLEAGLCLYGHDIDAATTPVEAALTWSISPSRRPGGERAGGYPGAGTVALQLAEGASRRRMLLRPDGRQPAREGAPIVDEQGRPVGTVTSGGFGPSVNGPVAMGYVAIPKLDSPLFAEVRGKRIPLQRQNGPFVAPQYFRG